jgi:cytochrome P450
MSTEIDGVDPEVVDPEVVLWNGFADEPQLGYRQLLAQCPVARSSGGRGMTSNSTVYILGLDEVTWAMRHPEVFSSAGAATIGQEQPLIPLQQDPPLHTSYRRLLNPMFSPKRIAQLEPEVRRLVNGLIDRFESNGHCDFNDEFATPLPSTIFLRLFGLPYSDLPMFLRWRDNDIRPDVDDHEAAGELRAQTGKEINAYFEAAIERVRKEPAEGLLTDLVHSTFEGRPLTQVELLGICHLLLLGGLDTVTASLDCMVTYLARHPDRRRQLTEDPSIIGPAVEEMLRMETPVQIVPRVVAQPHTICGVDLEPGESVALVIGAANVDERAFTNALQVDLSRDSSRHLAFSGGYHFCLGVHLARLELRVALEELHRRIPDYRIPDDADVHFSPGIRQAFSLPLVWP